MTLNIHKFAEKYADSYDWLYEQDTTGEATREYAEAFDTLMGRSKSFKAFVQAFVEYRKDFISSDREAAAFILTMERMTGNASYC